MPWKVKDAVTGAISPPAKHSEGSWKTKVDRAMAARAAAKQSRQGKPTAFSTRRVPGR